MNLGKRSQQKMTDLASEQRIQRSIKRKQKEEEKRRKAELEFAKALAKEMLLPDVEPQLPKLPMRAPPIHMSPAMHQLIQIEQERRKKKRK